MCVSLSWHGGHHSAYTGNACYTRIIGLCSIMGCDDPQASGGYCNGHYLKLRRYGDPLASARRVASPGVRFWTKVKRGDECWEWQGEILWTGYGRFSVSPKVKILAHRYAYEATNGAIPEGLVIDHLCRNRRCVNPDHLEPVTRSENVKRGLPFRQRPPNTL